MIMTKRKRIFVMSTAQLEALSTRQLLARLRQLQQCEESLALSDRQSGGIPGCIEFKQTADWAAAYQQLRQILSNREHVLKGGELAQRRAARAQRAKSSEKKTGIHVSTRIL
jgi:hypothetical protein